MEFLFLFLIVCIFYIHQTLGVTNGIDDDIEYPDTCLLDFSTYEPDSNTNCTSCTMMGASYCESNNGKGDLVIYNTTTNIIDVEYGVDNNLMKTYKYPAACYCSLDFSCET
jgi:hypothetical protein